MHATHFIVVETPLHWCFSSGFILHHHQNPFNSFLLFLFSSHVFLSSFLLILFRSLYVYSERFCVKVPLKQFVLKYLLHNFYFKIMSNQYWIFIQLLSVKNLVLDISIWNIYSIYNIVYYTLQGWKAWIISIRFHQQYYDNYSPVNIHIIDK